MKSVPKNVTRLTLLTFPLLWSALFSPTFTHSSVSFTPLANAHAIPLFPPPVVLGYSSPIDPTTGNQASTGKWDPMVLLLGASIAFGAISMAVYFKPD